LNNFSVDTKLYDLNDNNFESIEGLVQSSFVPPKEQLNSNDLSSTKDIFDLGIL
jgi:hypothetical protein